MLSIGRFEDESISPVDFRLVIPNFTFQIPNFRKSSFPVLGVSGRIVVGFRVKAHTEARLSELEAVAIVGGPLGEPFGGRIREPNGEPVGERIREPLGEPFGGRIREPLGGASGKPNGEPGGEPL